MRDFLDSKLIEMKLRAWDFMSRLKEEERGDTNFVAMIIIIVILIGVAGVFKIALEQSVTDVFKKLSDFIKK